MFEETNQTDSGIFEESEEFSSAEFEKEISDGESAGGDETEELSPDEDASSPKADENTDSYTVRYNGKDVNLSLEELKTNAQKGLNYDHIKQEFDELRSSSVFKEIMKKAKQEGISVSDYLKNDEKNRMYARVNELVKSGIDENEAKRILEAEEEIARRDAAEHEMRPYSDFAKRFPDVNPESIPDEVWDKFNLTGNLIEAYTEYENEMLKSKIAAMEQNEKNRQNSIGTLKNASQGGEYDAFLEGLCGK